MFVKRGVNHLLVGYGKFVSVIVRIVLGETVGVMPVTGKITLIGLWVWVSVGERLARKNFGVGEGTAAPPSNAQVSYDIPSDISVRPSISTWALCPELRLMPFSPSPSTQGPTRQSIASRVASPG